MKLSKWLERHHGVIDRVTSGESYYLTLEEADAMPKDFQKAVKKKRCVTVEPYTYFNTSMCPDQWRRYMRPEQQ
jgi:dihydrodipicolinate synthase/N-acetylneuraminate lyase